MKKFQELVFQIISLHLNLHQRIFVLIHKHVHSRRFAYTAQCILQFSERPIGTLTPLAT